MARRKQANVLRDTFHQLRYILIFSVIFSLIYGLLKLAGPLFMILVFDRVLPSGSEATLVALLLLLVIIITMMTLLDYSRRRILGRFGAQFQERIEDHIFSSTVRGAYYYRVGSKPAAGLAELDQLRGFFHSGSLITILDFLWSPVFLAVIFLIGPLMGWVVVAGLALLFILTTVRGYFAKSREERSSEATDKVGDLKHALVVSRSVIESQQMMGAYNKRWVTARRASRDKAVELKDWTAWFSVMSSHTATLVQYVALAAGAYLTIKGELTIGAMIACMYLARHVLHPADRFLKQIPEIKEAIANWKTLDGMLGAASDSTAVPDDGAVLSLSQLAVRCSTTKKKLLRNLNTEIMPGSVIEIVGNSGSGKTVLAETLVGRHQRSGGNIKLGAVDLDRLTIADAANLIGYIPQRVDFLHGTLEENIAGLATEPDKERLEHVARMAQMHDKIITLPEGYATRIDAAGSLFSKGERHRLALARALYPDPKVLIVDEPDATFREALSKSLKRDIDSFLARGGILIMLNRVALKNYQPTRRLTLDNGLLTEVALEPRPESKVIRIPT